MNKKGGKKKRRLVIRGQDHILQPSWGSVLCWAQRGQTLAQLRLPRKQGQESSGQQSPRGVTQSQPFVDEAAELIPSQPGRLDNQDVVLNVTIQLSLHRETSVFIQYVFCVNWTIDDEKNNIISSLSSFPPKGLKRRSLSVAERDVFPGLSGSFMIATCKIYTVVRARQRWRT